MQILASLAFAAFTALTMGAVKAQTITGPNATLTSGEWLLSQNEWGASHGVGSQSSTLIHAEGNSISWSTAYTWANNPNDVKSFANVENTLARNVPLADIKSAPTGYTWEYEYQSPGLRANVIYDIWTGTTPGLPASRASSYEIQIWLSEEGGVQPVGSQVASGISVGGYKWNLWTGTNSHWHSISFVSAEGNLNNFQSDLKDFFNYVTKNQGVPASQILQAIQAGTEAYTGTAKLFIEDFDVTLNT